MNLKKSCLLLWSATAFSLVAGQQSDYCAISRSHTLCQFTGVSSSCGQPIQSDFTSGQKAQAVALHNDLRARVAQGQESRSSSGAPQPPAANMEEMLWDDELALVAQRWAEQCNFGHDTNRDIDRFRVGQNVYETSRSRDQALGAALRAGVMGWYDEVMDFDPSVVDRYAFNSGVGHYTQMLWASTNRVGCGHMTYNDGRWIKKLIVCNYGPAGNFIGSSMYRRGNACSACPEGTSCSSTNPGLCAVGPPPTAAAPTTTTTAAAAAFNPADNEIETNEVETFDGFVPSQPLTPRPTRPAPIRPTRPTIPDEMFFNNNNNFNEIDDGFPVQPAMPTRPTNPIFNFGGFFRPSRPTTVRPTRRPFMVRPRPTRRPNATTGFFGAIRNMMGMRRPMRNFSSFFG